MAILHGLQDLSSQPRIVLGPWQGDLEVLSMDHQELPSNTSLYFPGFVRFCFILISFCSFWVVKIK